MTTTFAIPTDFRGAEAFSRIARYRENHRIAAVHRYTGDSVGARLGIDSAYCAHCGIDLRRRKGGFVHDPDEVRNFARLAGPVPSGKCWTCKRTVAAHLRLNDLADAIGVRTIPADVNDDGLWDAPVGGYTVHDFVA